MVQLIGLKNLHEHPIIDGVITRPLKINRDETGILVETMRKDWQDVYGEGRDFAMQYYSVTQSGIARDESVWHYHPGGQEDRFLVVSGTIVTAIADQRKESPTFGLLNLFVMDSEKSPYIIVIPKRTLHGFLVISKIPAILLNFPTRLYDPNEEGRIPHEEALVKNSDGSLFVWNDVRNIPLSSLPL